MLTSSPCTGRAPRPAGCRVDTTARARAATGAGTATVAASKDPGSGCASQAAQPLSCRVASVDHRRARLEVRRVSLPQRRRESSRLQPVVGLPHDKQRVLVPLEDHGRVLHGGYHSLRSRHLRTDSTSSIGAAVRRRSECYYPASESRRVAQGPANASPNEPRRDVFGALLRAHRLAAGLTQEDLAERAGLSLRAIQNLERGDRRPYADSANRLVAALSLEGDERAAFELAARPQPRAGRAACASPRSDAAHESANTIDSMYRTRSGAD